MLVVEDSDIITQTDVVVNALKHSKIGVITGEAFQRKAFPVLEEKVNRQYPYTVKIPKSIDQMLQGDFEPAKTFQIEKPIDGPYSHMWFGDATSGIKLLCGYINGDNRYIFDQELGDAIVHGIMVGATGQGKSVTLNSIIYNACTLYAPWELHLTLSDAKIVEFKSIALNNPMPQIETVAATGDVDYLLSVLEDKVTEMNKLNSVFVKTSEVYGKPCKKIAEFRKITGLSLPQNLLIFDEFQTMFTKAGKLSGRITKALDAFARLGRNTGYHLLLTSQELGTELPKDTLKNISFRGAMGCAPDVSDMILGNTGAAQNLGRKGKMIVNLNSMSKDENAKDTAKDNINITVPYIDPQTSFIAQTNIAKGKQLQVTPKLRFYDEFAVEYPKEFEESIKKLPNDPNVIYLGEPSFVSNDPTGRLKLDMSNREENSNIMVVSAVQTDLLRHFDTLKMNALLHLDTNNIVLCTGSIYERHGAHDLTGNLFFEDKDYEHSQVIAITRSLIYRRLLCLETDKRVFSDGGASVDLDTVKDLFYTIVEHDSELDTELNQIRFYYMKNLINTDARISKGFGDISNEAKLSVLQSTLQTFHAYGAAGCCLTKAHVPDLNIWMLGIDRLLGLGIDSKSRWMENFKLLLIDCNSANVRFTMFANTFAEFTTIRDLIHWYIMDHPIMNDITKIDKEGTYPDNVGGSLAVLLDTKNKSVGCQKFKKLFYDGEIPT